MATFFNTAKYTLVLGIVSLGIMSQALAAAPATKDTKACNQIVQATKDEWNAIGYQNPTKPTMTRVYGKYGHENSPTEVQFMQNQMKLAEADCKSGNQQAAMQRVSSIHNLLDAHGIAPETANAAMAPKKQ